MRAEATTYYVGDTITYNVTFNVPVVVTSLPVRNIGSATLLFSSPTESTPTLWTFAVTVVNTGTVSIVVGPNVQATSVDGGLSVPAGNATFAPVFAVDTPSVKSLSTADVLAESTGVNNGFLPATAAWNEYASVLAGDINSGTLTCASTTYGSGTYTSADLGDWKSNDLFKVITGDPVNTVSAFYRAPLVPGDMQLQTSTDKGVTFGVPTVSTGISDDLVSATVIDEVTGATLAVANDGSSALGNNYGANGWRAGGSFFSPGHAAVGVTVVGVDGAPSGTAAVGWQIAGTIEISFTEDGGLTWGPPTTITNLATTSTQRAFGMCALRGVVVVTYIDGASATHYTIVSTDGTATTPQTLIPGTVAASAGISVACSPTTNTLVVFAEVVFEITGYLFLLLGDNSALEAKGSTGGLAQYTTYIGDTVTTSETQFTVYFRTNVPTEMTQTLAPTLVNRGVNSATVEVGFKS